MAVHSESWSKIECELVMSDYMSMLTHEIRGEVYNKTEHRRQLLAKLGNRSEGSIEYKHQNISAVLILQGYLYIAGYKPAFNYQGLLKETVLNYIGHNQRLMAMQADQLIDSDEPMLQPFDWQQLVCEPPEIELPDEASSVREYRPRHYNFGDREAGNRRLGESGEALVLDFEKQRLVAAGRYDLAEEIEWTSKVKGDGAGYDIRSFDETQDRERFIEVKTTRSGKYQPFLISENEVAFSLEHQDQYSLYRVYKMRKDPRLFMLHGRLSDHVHLSPSVSRASFS